MQDNELIASFEPKLKGWVLVMAYDSLEDMFLDQERITAAHRQVVDDEGVALPQVETLWLGESQFGQRLLMSDQISTGLLVSSVAGLKEIELARRGWAQDRMRQTSRLELKKGTSVGWVMSVEQMDIFDRYGMEVLEPSPAGNNPGSPRIKTHIARQGFNFYCMDHDRPDLQLNGVSGGKAFSGALQAMFPEAVAVLQDESGNPYYHGLSRKEGVNRKYFRLP